MNHILKMSATFWAGFAVGALAMFAAACVQIPKSNARWSARLGAEMAAHRDDLVSCVKTAEDAVAELKKCR